MFSRTLTHDEEEIIRVIEAFVRDKHKQANSHDYSHVLEVTQHSIDIAERIPEPVDPFILICGALLHDIGKTNLLLTSMHGLLGSALAEKFLEALGYSYPALNPVRDQICRIVSRHTSTTMVSPETAEEKIVFDADTIDRLGVIGVLRGFIGKEGSIEQILESKMATRIHDFELLNYDASKKLAKKLNEEALRFIAIIRKSLDRRKAEVKELELHGAKNRDGWLS
jgi:uncharacterized protein